MDPHQKPGALDALIQDGLAMQGMGQTLDQLVHESVQDVLGSQLPDVGPLDLHGTESFGLPPMSIDIPDMGALPMDAGAPPQQQPESNKEPTHNSGAGGIANNRPRRRAAAAAANFATDVEGSEDESEDEGDVQETGSSGRPVRASKRRRNAAGGASAAVDANKTEKRTTNMVGRFSGRLPTKDCEKKLVDECILMAPLLSEDGSLLTLPNIVRAMATGSVRAYLERQKQELDAKTDLLHSIQAAQGPNSVSLSEQIVLQHQDNARLRDQINALEQQLLQAGINVRTTPPPSDQQQQQPIQRMGSLNAGAVAAALGQGGVPLPVQTVAMSVPTGGQPAQPVVMATAPQVVQVPAAAQVVQVPAETAFVAQQVLPGGAQPVVVAAVQPSAAGTTGLLRSIPSTAQIIDPTGGQPTGAVAVVQQPVAVAAAPPPAAAPPADDAAAKVAGVAASNLNEHAQQFAITAKLHEAAKAEASVQAQQLAAQAQQHAHASVQAAQQAEELKKTISVLPDSHQAQQAAATVQNLEARAQAHASITTQVVAQARGMHEKAKAHENEQFKAITQATVLQAHAQSLQVSAQQMDAQNVVTQAVNAAEPAQTLQPAATASGPIAVTAPMPSLQPAPAVVPTASGGALASGQDPARLPTTPLSTASGGGNLLGGNAVQAAAPANAAPVAAVVQHNGQMQLVQMQPATATLMHAAPSGDQSAEVAALHQQIAVLQAQQQQQQQQQQVEYVAVAAPPPGTTIAMHPAVIQQPMGMTRVASHNVIGILQASGSVALDSNSLAGAAAPPPLQQQEQQAQLAHVPLPPAGPAPANSNPPNASLDVPQGLENLLPSSQPLVMDPFAAPPTAAEMEPVVMLPTETAKSVEVPPVSTSM